MRTESCIVDISGSDSLQDALLEIMWEAIDDDFARLRSEDRPAWRVEAACYFGFPTYGALRREVGMDES